MNTDISYQILTEHFQETGSSVIFPEYIVGEEYMYVFDPHLIKILKIKHHINWQNQDDYEYNTTLIICAYDRYNQQKQKHNVDKWITKFGYDNVINTCLRCLKESLLNIECLLDSFQLDEVTDITNQQVRSRMTQWFFQCL